MSLWSRLFKRRCATCRDPFHGGMRAGVSDLEATPRIKDEDAGYNLTWRAELVMMTRSQYRCRDCAREFWGPPSYVPGYSRTITPAEYAAMKEKT